MKAARCWRRRARVERWEERLTFSKSKFSNRLVGSQKGRYYMCWPQSLKGRNCSVAGRTRTCSGSGLAIVHNTDAQWECDTARVSRRWGSTIWTREGLTRERGVSETHLEQYKGRLCAGCLEVLWVYLGSLDWSGLTVSHSSLVNPIINCDSWNGDIRIIHNYAKWQEKAGFKCSGLWLQLIHKNHWCSCWRLRVLLPAFKWD